jgi:hypothetical protein
MVMHFRWRDDHARTCLLDFASDRRIERGQPDLAARYRSRPVHHFGSPLEIGIRRIAEFRPNQRIIIRCGNGPRCLGPPGSPGLLDGSQNEATVFKPHIHRITCRQSKLGEY